MDIDRFTSLADQLMEQVPPPLLEGLNGGVSVRRRAMRSRSDPAGVYILGEYITDAAMGCYIVLYYGSFVALFDGEPDAIWEEELWTTIKHELRHHVEERAGERSLDIEDEVELAQFRQELPPADEMPAPRRFKPSRRIRKE